MLSLYRDNAVLFIDEADSLLSKRLLHVTQGSEQAINSIRSQLFICLEQYQGIVIFATNLVEKGREYQWILLAKSKKAVC
ncbi:MAG: AAA family ATPase [Stigonema ocellatum SAG 48.90 = DSM 106950]|nr:AAA family ATPase [Stigonema ocellatum SAG 48.90 = DSM 106950]